jgi:hypothetical protein
MTVNAEPTLVVDAANAADKLPTVLGTDLLREWLQYLDGLLGMYDPVHGVSRSF